MKKSSYSDKLKKIRQRNRYLEQKQKLKDERNKYKKKLPSTSKLILTGVLLLCFQIVLFCEYAMIKTNDLSSLYVLIGIPAALAPTVISYMIKSRDENISKYSGLVFEEQTEEPMINIAEEIEQEDEYEATKIVYSQD